MAKKAKRAKRTFGGTYERRGVWYVRYSVHGKRHHVVGGTKAEAEAVLARLTTERARERIEGRPVGEPLTLAEFAPRLWTVWEALLRPATITSRQKVIRHYGAVLKRPMRDLTAPEAEAVLHRRLRDGLRPSSVHHDRRVLASAWSLAARMDVVPETRNPWRRVRLPAIEREPHHVLTPEESVRLVAAAPADLLLPVLLALDAGLRRGEILALRRGDVSADGVTVRAAVAKSHRFRTVPITGRLAAALETKTPALPSATLCPINASRYNHGLRELLDGVGREDVRPHDLRHTYAQRLADLGVPLIVVRDLLGHSSISTTEAVYVGRAPARSLREAVARLDAHDAAASG